MTGTGNAPHPHELLIVDDEEPIRRLLAAYFEDLDGFLVRTAASGEEALDALAARHADLCVVDMRLPGINGEQFILAAAARGLSRHFLVHTGSVEMAPGAALRVAGVGPEDVFVKPHDAERLAERIRHLLGMPGGSTADGRNPR
ncbi:response regulator [Nitratidesulfovibrio sp. 1201_IL3209]|jgi:DNA-binding NtrC family response regulator|uniref:response regulator n=1 Tax=Nitratidesulfovibrio sp. 1201_IL3209 TaxID=3084053 RepID=UPI002FDA1447